MILRNFKFVLVFASALFLSTACFMPSNRMIEYGCVAEKPAKSDFVGTWIADKATLKDMRVRGKYDPTIIPKIILQKNGQIEIKDIPNWWKGGFGVSNGLFESYKGEWKFSNLMSDCYHLNLELNQLVTTFSIYESRFSSEKDYIITLVIGDPDSGDSMVFVKMK